MLQGMVKVSERKNLTNPDKESQGWLFVIIV